MTTSKNSTKDSLRFSHTRPETGRPTAGRASRNQPAGTAAPSALDITYGFLTDHNSSTSIALELVYPKNLLLDHEIQRSEQKGEVNAIAGNFRADATGAVIVSARPKARGTGEDYYLVDGQQRRAAALAAGYDKQFLAIVYRGLTFEQEAELFLAYNYRRAVSAWDKYKARVSAQEPLAMAVKEVLDLTAVPVGGSKGFQAISTADKIIQEKNGRARLIWGLNTISEAYAGEGTDGSTGNPYAGQVIDGFAIFFAWHGARANTNRLVTKLKEHGDVKDLLSLAHTHQRINGGSTSLALAQALVTIYNKNTHSDARNGHRLSPITSRIPSKSQTVPAQRATKVEEISAVEDNEMAGVTE